MRLVTTLGLGLILGTPATFAQDAVKPDLDAKSVDSTQAAKLAEKRDEVQKAERGLREAQQAIQKAQRDVQKAHREADTAAREQMATARTKLTVVPGQRMVVTRSGAARDLFPGTVPIFAAFGMQLVEADPVLRAQLGLPADQGLVVTQVVEKRLADQAGIKLNDIVIKLDDKPVGKVAQVQEALPKVGKRSVEAELIREGKPRKLSLVGPEHGIPDSPTSYWIGVPVAPVDATLRSHLTALPEGAGLIATDIVAESPAAKAGIKKNDILLKLNDKSIATQEALVDLVQKSEGKESKVEVVRAGKVLLLTLTPEKRAARSADSVSATIDFGDGPQVFMYNGLNLKRDPTDAMRTTNLSPLIKSGELPVRISSELVNSLKGLESKTLDSLKLDAQLDAALQQQMKALTGQVEDLRRAIEEMKKSLPLGKDSKTGLNFSEGGIGSLVFFPGAFW